MTELDGWEQIQQRGLLSTTALLNHFPVSEQRRWRIESCHRSEDEELRPGVVIRHQRPLSHSRLQGLLTDDITTTAWYQLLNSNVFFWTTCKRRNSMLKAQMPKVQEVLTIDTRRLVDRHEERITLSRLNSGDTRNGGWRDSQTFRTIEKYPTITHKDQVAEVAVECCVADIVELTLRVDRYLGCTWREKIWPLDTADFLSRGLDVRFGRTRIQATTPGQHR